VETKVDILCFLLIFPKHDRELKVSVLLHRETYSQFQNNAKILSSLAHHLTMQFSKGIMIKMSQKHLAYTKFLILPKLTT